MENKLKSMVITLLILILCAVGVYGFTRDVQFMGILFAGVLIALMSVGLYKTVYSHLNNKTKNKKS